MIIRGNVFYARAASLKWVMCGVCKELVALDSDYGLMLMCRGKWCYVAYYVAIRWYHVFEELTEMIDVTTYSLSTLYASLKSP